MNVAINCEATDIIFHDGWYYLLATHGSCCSGANSSYNIRMGRSEKVTGPYLDDDGVDMIQGGGKLFCGSGGRFIGAGHFGLLDEGDGVQKFSLHWEADLDLGGASVLDIRPLLWRDEWPVAGENFKEGTYQIESVRTGTALELAVEGVAVGGGRRGWRSPRWGGARRTWWRARALAVARRPADPAVRRFNSLPRRAMPRAEPVPRAELLPRVDVAVLRWAEPHVAARRAELHAAAWAADVAAWAAAEACSAAGRRDSRSGRRRGLGQLADRPDGRADGELHVPGPAEVDRDAGGRRRGISRLALFQDHRCRHRPHAGGGRGR